MGPLPRQCVTRPSRRPPLLCSGLELSLDRLQSMAKLVFGMGTAQVGAGVLSLQGSPQLKLLRFRVCSGLARACVANVPRVSMRAYVCL
jgi:hypothetical protein